MTGRRPWLLLPLGAVLIALAIATTYRRPFVPPPEPVDTARSFDVQWHDRVPFPKPVRAIRITPQ